jgi:2-(1,2-epoxy-1,2-dihydrophenyl)acetyl-CoA isomerase
MTTVSYDQLIGEAAATDAELVLVERDGSHAVVTMNDPDKLNALSAPLTIQLRERLTELAAEPAIRTIILTGTDPAFSAGGDLRLMRDFAQPLIHDSDEGATGIWRWIRMQFGAIARLITRTDKAFVAAVGGPAAGVGLAFGLACDLILVSERAQIVPAFGRIGLIPEVGTSWLLTRRLGYQRTFELFAGGRHLSGEEAAEIGLANALVPHEQLIGAAREWAGRIDALPSHVVPMMKPLLRQATDLTWEQAIAMEEFAEPMTFTTRAHQDAVAALLTRN